jgi:hypothetical protein
MYNYAVKTAICIIHAESCKKQWSDKMIRLIALMLMSTAVVADQPEVVNMVLEGNGQRGYRVDVTLRHADTGWDHYADGWDVLDADKKVIATRVLYHPHVDEQPFTRSLSGVHIPADATIIYIRPHDKVHGYGELYQFDMKKVLSD